MTDDIPYDELSEYKKKRLAEVASSLGYKIEGTTDEKVKEYFTNILKEYDELKKKLNKEEKIEISNN